MSNTMYWNCRFRLPAQLRYRSNPSSSKDQCEIDANTQWRISQRSISHEALTYWVNTRADGKACPQRAFNLGLAFKDMQNANPKLAEGFSHCLDISTAEVCKQPFNHFGIEGSRRRLLENFKKETKEKKTSARRLLLYQNTSSKLSEFLLLAKISYYQH